MYISQSNQQRRLDHRKSKRFRKAQKKRSYVDLSFNRLDTRHLGANNPVVRNVSLDYEANYENQKKNMKDEEEYSDGLLYDVLSQREILVNGKNGRWILLLSLLLQSILIILLFLSYHHRTSKFDCCNMWAVCMVIIFLGVQFLYFIDWEGIYGHDPSWHRANIIVPLIILLLIFLEWGAAMLSMIAHSLNLELFTYDWDNLTGRERAGFFMSTLLFLSIISTQLSLSWAHRNNLGQFYYVDNETGVEEVEISTRAIPVQGSFDFRHVIHLMAHLYKVDCTAFSLNNMPRLMCLSTFIQLTFYVYLSWSYSEGNNSSAPLSFIILGYIFVLQQAHNAWKCFTSKLMTKTRKWNRQNLFYPILPLYIASLAYFFTFSSIFFRSFSVNAEIWEDVLEHLDKSEKAYLGVTTALVSIIVVVQIYLANVHRKGWSDGKRDLEMMLHALTVEAQALYPTYQFRSQTTENNFVVEQTNYKDHDNSDTHSESQSRLSQPPPIAQRNSLTVPSIIEQRHNRLSIASNASSVDYRVHEVEDF